MESFLLFYLQPMFGCIRLKLHIPFSYMPFWNMKRTKLPMIDINFRALIHLHLGHLREKHEQRTTVHLENNIFSDSNFQIYYGLLHTIPASFNSTQWDFTIWCWLPAWWTIGTATILSSNEVIWLLLLIYKNMFKSFRNNGNKSNRRSLLLNACWKRMNKYAPKMSANFPLVIVWKKQKNTNNCKFILHDTD